MHTVLMYIFPVDPSSPFPQFFFQRPSWTIGTCVFNRPIVLPVTQLENLTHRSQQELEEASTHKSANTHAGTAFLTDLNLWPFDYKINGFPGLVVEHLYVTFGVSFFFWDNMQRNRQTERQTAVSVANNDHVSWSSNCLVKTICNDFFTKLIKSSF